jgi:hypothetical protein
VTTALLAASANPNWNAVLVNDSAKQRWFAPPPCLSEGLQRQIQALESCRRRTRAHRRWGWPTLSKIRRGALRTVTRGREGCLLISVGGGDYLAGGMRPGGLAKRGGSERCAQQKKSRCSQRASRRKIHGLPSRHRSRKDSLRLMGAGPGSFIGQNSLIGIYLLDRWRDVPVRAWKCCWACWRLNPCLATTWG